MTEPGADLFEAFREDHALLGTGFHELSTWLRAGNLAEAIRVAQRLDRGAGPHIAFEEEVFYPKISELLGPDQVERLLIEHGEGFDVVYRLCTMDPGVGPSPETRQVLLAQSEAMETHIAECGELFNAIRRIPTPQQKILYDQLVRWRRRAPTWRSYVGERGRHEA